MDERPSVRRTTAAVGIVPLPWGRDRERWTTLVPPAALVALAIAWVTHPEGPFGVTVIVVALIVTLMGRLRRRAG
jgi:hypothetical protein